MCKKIRSYLIISLLCVLSCGFIFSVKSEAASKDWYKQILESNTGVYRKKSNGVTKTAYRSEFHYYKFLDINKDGKKELLLSDAPDSWIDYTNKVVILVHHKKKVKVLDIIDGPAGGGCLYYNKKRLVIYDRAAGYSHYSICKLSKGKLKNKIDLKYYQVNHYGNNDFPVCFKNGKKCSEKTFDKYLNKYHIGRNDITYKKII